MEKFDITIVAHDVGGIGGMELQLTELITGLLHAGNRVTAISRTCSLPCHSRLRWIRVPGPSRPFTIAYPLFLLLGSLLVSLRGRGVVHSTGAIILVRTDVCTVHFCHRAAARLPSFSRASRAGFVYRLNARIARIMSRLGEHWCYRPGRTGCLVGVSEGLARELRTNFPSMRERIMVISNGVDTDAFRPGNGLGSRNDVNGLNALFVGSEWARKGLQVAIEALPDCQGAQLTVVGDGDVDAYRALAEGLGVAERVSFVGATSDVASWYRRADAFLLPTAYEAAPLVTYEAAASGLPLLITKVNGVEDILDNGANGWFIDREAKCISGYLRTLQSNPELRASMGRQARQDSLQFTWSRVVDSYRDLYANLGQGVT